MLLFKNKFKEKKITPDSKCIRKLIKKKKPTLTAVSTAWI